MPRGSKWYLVGHGDPLDKMSRGRRRMRKGEPASTSLGNIGYSNSGKEKKMETRFQKLESAAGDGQTCSLLGSRDLQIVRPSVPLIGTRSPINSAASEALQPLVIETCNSRVIIKTSAKSLVRVGRFARI
jgi:predicted short-subunit dehydrogenase-like oxidoreductase (DUF2520 family)